MAIVIFIVYVFLLIAFFRMGREKSLSRAILYSILSLTFWIGGNIFLRQFITGFGVLILQIVPFVIISFLDKDKKEE